MLTVILMDNSDQLDDIYVRAQPDLLDRHLVQKLNVTLKSSKVDCRKEL
jgi:hypothetical protein